MATIQLGPVQVPVPFLDQMQVQGVLVGVVAMAVYLYGQSTLNAVVPMRR